MALRAALRAGKRTSGASRGSCTGPLKPCSINSAMNSDGRDGCQRVPRLGSLANGLQERLVFGFETIADQGQFNVAGDGCRASRSDRLSAMVKV
jgi:hypothetical protein